MLLALVGVAAFAGVYAVMGEEEAPRPLQSLQGESAQEDAASVVPDIGLALRPGASADEAAAVRVVRDVTPTSMTAGPKVTGALVRVQAPAPESKPPEQARHERLFNPIVIAAGTLKLRNREIVLAGIEAPAFDARCGEGARAWPCGRLARAALRSFIRRRAIECEVPPGAAEVPASARCSVAGADIAEWLVAQGWAKPAGDRFAAEARKAREAKLGLWGETRPDLQATEVAAGG